MNKKEKFLCFFFVFFFVAGTWSEELMRQFIGGGIELGDRDWAEQGGDRSHLRTVATGTVHLELGLIFRHFKRFGIEYWRHDELVVSGRRHRCYRTVGRWPVFDTPNCYCCYRCYRSARSFAYDDFHRLVSNRAFFVFSLCQNVGFFRSKCVKILFFLVFQAKMFSF